VSFEYLVEDSSETGAVVRGGRRSELGLARGTWTWNYSTRRTRWRCSRHWCSRGDCDHAESAGERRRTPERRLTACRPAADHVQPTAGLIGHPGVDSALIPAVFPLYRADRRSHDGVYVAPRWSRRVTHAPTARAGALLSRCTGRVKRRDPTSRARLRRLDDEHRRLDSASGLESGDRGHGLLVIVSSGPWQFRGVERRVRRTPTARR
jgi:hypothetical protein